MAQHLYWRDVLTIPRILSCEHCEVHMIKRCTHCRFSPTDRCERMASTPARKSSICPSDSFIWFIFRSQSQFAFRLLQSLTLLSRPLFTRYQVPPPESGLVQLGLGDNNQIRVYHYWSRSARLAPNVAPYASLRTSGATGSTVVSVPWVLSKGFHTESEHLGCDWKKMTSGQLTEGEGEGGSSAIRQQNTSCLSRQS